MGVGIFCYGEKGHRREVLKEVLKPRVNFLSSSGYLKVYHCVIRGYCLVLLESRSVSWTRNAYRMKFLRYAGKLNDFWNCTSQQWKPYYDFAPYVLIRRNSWQRFTKRRDHLFFQSLRKLLKQVEWCRPYNYACEVQKYWQENPPLKGEVTWEGHWI
jgi:hypothetical protein